MRSILWINKAHYSWKFKLLQSKWNWWSFFDWTFDEQWWLDSTSIISHIYSNPKSSPISLYSFTINPLISPSTTRTKTINTICDTTRCTNKYNKECPLAKIIYHWFSIDTRFIHVIKVPLILIYLRLLVPSLKNHQSHQWCYHY